MIHPLLFLPLPLYIFLMLSLASTVSAGWTWYFSAISLAPKSQPLWRAWSLQIGSLTFSAGVQYAPLNTERRF